MEESKETATKRPLEPSLPWIRNTEEAEDDTLGPIPKRRCTGRDGGDSFEEFFALLQRIQATQRNCFRTRDHVNRQEPAAKCAQTVASKASWRPSFEWEDFSSHRNGTHDVDSSDGQVLQKEVARPASNNLKQPSRKATPNPDLEGLDLNNLPAGLPLFQ